ncbi:MAG: TlpA family protein disulfide reductase [Candidatus Atribacteria bacterium]|nr:TlpA family protein disulfide reductase [Candidatus Atribacteria bacterium]
MRKRLFWAIGVFLLLFSGIYSLGAREISPFQLPGLDGKTYSLSDFKGEPVVISFSATWCPPCRQELPLLQKIYEEYKDKAQLNVLVIDSGEPQTKVEAFAQELGLTFPVLLDEEGKVAREYGILYLPTLYFVDPLGNLAAQIIGAQEESVLRNKLEQILWFRGLQEAEIKNLVELTSEVMVLDFRKENRNPFPDRGNVSYQVVDSVDSVISSFPREGVYLLLTESNGESLEIAKALAISGFQRVYYWLVDAPES